MERKRGVRRIDLLTSGRFDVLANFSYRVY